jgi:hypothetical protein
MTRYQEAEMIPCSDAKSSDWLNYRGNAIGNMIPPRDPDDDDDDVEEDEEDDDRNEKRDPAVIREPDE